MTIEIIYDYTRCRSTEYVYTIVMDGDVVGAANTYHAAELVAQEIERREDIAKLKGAIAALDEVDQAITEHIEALTVMPSDGSPAFTPDPNGYADVSPLKRCATCGGEGDCPDCNTPAPRGSWAVVTEYEDEAPSDETRCGCGSPALFFVQYPNRTYGYCPDCYREQSESREPLLAQCAHAIRAVLGNVPAGGGIIDELRRCDQALRREGW